MVKFNISEYKPTSSFKWNCAMNVFIIFYRIARTDQESCCGSMGKMLQKLKVNSLQLC